MKSFPFGFGRLAILLLTFPAAVSQPQTPSDEEAVRGTVVDYIEGYYAGDAVVAKSHSTSLRFPFGTFVSDYRPVSSDWLLSICSGTDFQSGLRECPTRVHV
jgi:hypothetical protein